MPMLRTHPLSLYEWLRIQSTQTKLNLALSNIDAALFPCSYVVGLRPVCKISTALDLCLLCWYYTQEHQCPKESQLATALSLLDGNDTFLYAGTGFGKTLSAILHMYLKEEHEITIIITPLKRIQASHARSLEEMYRFRVLVVNEETSRDAEFWKTRVHDLRKKIPGDVQVIVTTPEQLFRTPDGHYTRLGTLLREPAFKRRVRFIVVDEAHFIHTTGLALYGLSPFRKVYSRLDEIKALLGSCVPWLVLTATAPFNMLKTIESVALKPTYTTIRLALNRPNLTYACHQLVGGASCFDNFKCFLTQPFNLDLQPRVLIFVEDSAMAVQLALFLNQLLPSSLRSLRIVRHQHGNMSPQYQAETHDAFASVNGACRILISTSMEATAAGRTERDPNSSGLVLRTVGK